MRCRIVKAASESQENDSNEQKMTTTMKLRTFGAIGALILGGAAIQVARSADDQAKKSSAAKPATKMTIYDFKLPNLAGKPVDLSQYKGKTVLIVNTASNCGYTKQYAGLQQLHEKYGKDGLAILGFPANNFGGQEPGSDAEIIEFCQKNYGVSFDMFSKVSVKGADKAPFFTYLTQDANADLTGEIGWNFEKFLVSRDGKLVARFKSGSAPDSKELVGAVEAELAKK
jgi:glutathione peroxidase